MSLNQFKFVTIGLNLEQTATIVAQKRPMTVLREDLGLRNVCLTMELHCEEITCKLSRAARLATSLFSKFKSFRVGNQGENVYRVTFCTKPTIWRHIMENTTKVLYPFWIHNESKNGCRFLLLVHAQKGCVGAYINEQTISGFV